MIDLPMFDVDLAPPELARGCERALSDGLAAVYCRTHHVRVVARHLAGSDVATGTVVDWATSRACIDDRVAEAHRLLDEGAREITAIIRTERIQKPELQADVRREIASLVSACAAAGGRVKVLLHTPELSPDQTAAASAWASEAGAAIVQGGAWFARGAASLAELREMRHAVSPAVRVKVTARMDTLDLLLRHYVAGADRFNVADVTRMLAQVDQRVLRDGAVAVPEDDGSATLGPSRHPSRLLP